MFHPSESPPIGYPPATCEAGVTTSIEDTARYPPNAVTSFVVAPVVGCAGAPARYTVPAQLRTQRAPIMRATTPERTEPIGSTRRRGEVADSGFICGAIQNRSPRPTAARRQ